MGLSFRPVDGAIVELTQLVEHGSVNIQPLLTLAATYEALGENEDAVEIYNRALRIDIDEPKANLRLGITLTKMGRYLEALTPLRKAWSNDRHSAAAANALARTLGLTLRRCTSTTVCLNQP